MIESAKNKAMGDPESVGNVTITAHSQIVNEYHFAGTPNYQPLSVVANTIEEATEIWKTKRVPVEFTEPVVVTKSDSKPEEKPNDTK